MYRKKTKIAGRQDLFQLAVGLDFPAESWPLHVVARGPAVDGLYCCVHMLLATTRYGLFVGTLKACCSGYAEGGRFHAGESQHNPKSFMGGQNSA